MTHETLEAHINRVLIIVPKNLVSNWVLEFDKWRGKIQENSNGKIKVRDFLAPSF